MTDFVHEHKLRLRRYISRRVQAGDAVDDILQNVFLKAFQHLHTVKSRESIRAWLFRIASNAIADHYRSQKSMSELPDELAAPDDQDHITELATCLQPLIGDLPETYRSAIILSEIDGRPLKEVARHLGISLSGAKSRVQRGRDHLRRKLLDCCSVETGKGGISGYEPLSRNNECNCE